MRWIKKEQEKDGSFYKKEPEAFQSWKKQNKNANYKNFSEPKNTESVKEKAQKAKKELLKSLMEEQHGLCCYCGSRIILETDFSQRNCHIEHVKPQSKYSEKSMDYGNMLLSCNGEKKRESKKRGHCGEFRGNWYDEILFISPLNKDCENSFQYDWDGGIFSKKGNPGSQETIEHLGLEDSNLRRLREAALDGAGFFDPEEKFEDIIERYEIPDSNGQLPPFAFVIAAVLREMVEEE